MHHVVMQSTVEPRRTAPADEAVDMQQLPWIKDGNKLWETNGDRSIISVSATAQAEQGQPSSGPRSLASPAPAHQRLPNRAAAQ